MKRIPLDPWIAARIGGPERLLQRDALQAWQLARLRETVTIARDKSRWYRRHLQNAPVEPRSLDDLTAFPFSSADDIRQEPMQLLCVSQDQINRVVTLETSGTTGSPKRLYFTRDDQELTIDFFNVGMSTFTDPGDRVLILLPCQTPGSVGDLLATALLRLGAIPIKHGVVSDPAVVVEILQSERVDVVVGIPVQLLAMARCQREPAPRLKSVLFATDYASDAIRQLVQKTWHCEAYDHYGMTEMGLGGGVECDARYGYHLREADMLFEVIDPATGVAAPDGDYGEVVFTTLTRRGMPLIRYRTGDISRFIPGQCPCGSCLKRLDRITHRINGVVVLTGQLAQSRVGDSDTQITMARLDEAVFSVAGVIDYSASMSRPGNLDHLQLDAQVSSSNFKQGAEKVRESLTVAVQSVLRSNQNSAAPVPCSIEVQVIPFIAPLRRPAKRAIVDQRLAREFDQFPG